ncbi:hypothetical protein L226DRAFT_547592 [Lentinus tigrinus ALCF2SS1-7]|uniref:Brl1/Brr6 domain-containing protein n=1 Tax=Lentinus tigrinus ALCF2SS1-6 TaxID=1328759 RepID=A0A5C2S8E0_9APHY|nr:hypothetical protein L227DRAFT_503698 [Lentinus tigrinus ALCF2SS1-6]RPD70780.1 hypothetical protein L226DRAFT_547592 [Lentinus tigrinus ALCF2SS1-7]
MDFEFTSRPSSNQKPVWANPGEDPHTPRKRPFAEINPSTPSFPTPTFHPPDSPSWPTFSRHANAPFLFQEPLPQRAHSPAWAPPPPNGSPTKMSFPEPEIPEVDMAESSPGGPSPEKDKEADGDRPMAVGALRRVFKKRNERARSKVGRRRARVNDDESSEDESGDEEGYVHVQKTTNHYTLNMAGPGQQSDLPYRLLGYVQFGFNTSLAVIALYILVQFLLMLQRDVEHRVSEYSMDIVQEIAQCSLAYKTNLCAEGKVPAMAAQCAAWETCMNRDPTKVGRTKVSFEVIGEIINTFVEQISWKTITITIASLVFVTFFVNSVIMLFRSRINPVTHLPPPHVPPYPIAPGLPYPGPHGYLPAPQDWSHKPWKQSDADTELPTRRRRLEDGQAAKVR